MSTTYEVIDDPADVLSSSVVKIAIDAEGYATAFSRNPIHWSNQAVDKHGPIDSSSDVSELLFSFKKHTGLYAYRREFLLEFARWPQSDSERQESLEQMRALDRGVKIKVVEAASRSIGVDTKDDLERVRAIIEKELKVPA